MVVQSQHTSSWPQLLKSVLFCMNSTHKKSHGNTPYRIMWGRNFRYEDLIPNINNISVSAEDDMNMEEVILSLNDIVEEGDLPDTVSPLQEQLQESIKILDQFRSDTFELASEKIRTEQLKQKRQYDKKVSQKR